MAYLKLNRQIEAARARRAYRPRITLEMYKQALKERRPLLQLYRTLVTDSALNNESYWKDAPPWLDRPEDVDDGHGAIRGRGIQRPISTAKLEPRAQGSMPGRTAKAVMLKEQSLMNREFDPVSGKVVSNKMPSERSHRVGYSQKAVRITKRLEDGKRVVVGRSGKVLKTLTKRLNPVRRQVAWKVLTQTEA